MIKEKIQKELVDNIQLHLGEAYEVSPDTICKNNNVGSKVIRVRKKGEKYSAVLHVNNYIDRIICGEQSVTEVVSDLIETYAENNIMTTGFSVENITNSDFIYSHVIYQVINAEKNEERLSDYLHRRFLDLAVVYYVCVDSQCGYLLTNEYIEVADLDMDTLERSAKKNTEMSGFYMEEITNCIERLLLGLDDISKTIRMDICKEMAQDPFLNFMYVITNSDNSYGANILACPEIFAKLTESMDGDLYILPASIDEVIVLPAFVLPKDCAPSLRELVNSVNCGDVMLPEKVLGSNVYKFDRQTKEIHICN